jgi:hypothetical protein
MVKSQFLSRLDLLSRSGDSGSHEIFYFISVTYAQVPPTAVASMRFTEYGLIFFAGQQRLTRAQVAKTAPSSGLPAF